MISSNKKKTTPSGKRTKSPASKSERPLVVSQTLQFRREWPAVLGAKPDDWFSIESCELAFRGPNAIFLQFLLMDPEDLGEFMKTHIFNHAQYRKALQPKPRGKSPDRPFNFALHSVNEWAKTHDKQSRLEGLYAKICDSTPKGELYYPAEVACFVAGKFFGERVPLAHSSPKENQVKRCRDFIRKHPCHYEKDQLPQLILYGEALANIIVKRKNPHSR